MATGSTASLLVLLTALTVTLLLAGYISSASHHQVQNAHIVGSFTDTRKLLRQLTVSVNKTRGLEARDHWFWIDGKKTRLFSGAIHYFRIPREYWKDRLIKLRSSGCNVLETYVPWNLHEPHRGEYNFKDMLDLRAYVKLAEECGLFVILRPGPYICSEWDLGGLPSWLLSDSEMKLRSTYQPFIKSVESYFQELLPHVTDLQYSNGGGPIIAWQIENEYGSFGDDTDYLLQIQKVLMLEYGCTELMFTSDNKQGIDNGGIEGGEDFQFPVFVSIILNFV
ncbi:GLB1L2 [Bugula neritina]|uniref:GLB1L2 n=1 Tax=Bugula neritina TaxID=10212 RepID=A0A7J7JP01_BUGNE|nr:GLB1L2 [Bugula neritina]